MKRCDDRARREYRNGIASYSCVKGDESNPQSASANSAAARFFHTECHEAFGRRCILPRFRRLPDGDEVPLTESEATT